MDEIAQLFEQVDLREWYPVIKEETMLTIWMTVSPQQASSLLQYNLFVRNQPGSSPLDSSQEKELEGLKKDVDKVLQSHKEFKSRDGSGYSAFVKLLDRSPKDQVDGEKVKRMYEERVEKMKKSGENYSNTHLQAFVWAKARSLIVHSGEEVVKMMGASERIGTDLEIHFVTKPDEPVTMLFREWVDIDPAYEFRTFVCRDKMTGMSQMASMDVRLHYPQLFPIKQQLEESAEKFFQTKLREPLSSAVTARGPSSSYVMDLYWDGEREKWYVIELNPFETSSLGHLFHFFGDDLEILRKGPFEFRIRDDTPSDTMHEDLSPEWITLLSKTSDVYGIKEDQFFQLGERGEEERGGERGRERGERESERERKVYVVIVASGEPVFSKDVNEDESRQWVKECYEVLRDRYNVPEERMHVLVYREEDKDLYRNSYLSSSSNLLNVFAQLSDSLKAEGPCNVCIHFVGHGKRDVVSWDLDIVTLDNGAMGFAPQFEEGSSRSWLNFPHPSANRKPVASSEEINILGGEKSIKTYCEGGGGGDSLNFEYSEFVLHWHTLALSLLELSFSVPSPGYPKREPNRLFFFMGACYSAALFQWIPQLSPVDSISTTKEERENAQKSLTKMIQKKALSFFSPLKCLSPLLSKKEENFFSSLSLPLTVITSSNKNFAISTFSWWGFMNLLKRRKKREERGEEEERGEDERELGSLGEGLEWLREGKERVEGVPADDIERLSLSWFSFCGGDMLNDSFASLYCSSSSSSSSSASAPSSSLSPSPSPSPSSSSSLSLSSTFEMPTFEKGDISVFIGNLEDPFFLDRALIEESFPDFAPFLTESNKIEISRGTHCPKDFAKQILAFQAIPQPLRHKKWKPSPTWQEILDCAISLQLFEVVGGLVEWREGQMSADKDDVVMRGDCSNLVFPGWFVSSGSLVGAEVDLMDAASWNDYLGFALECEGNGMQILSYYRPENIEEDEWLSLPMNQRFNQINGNWARLKNRIDSSKVPYHFVWMNRNLTIEDAGFLWEVSYGGSTPGFSLDPEHIISEMDQCVAMGLTTADREMDSGFQIHISFPFMRDEKQEIREKVLSFMVLLDDFLFLRSFDRSIIDDCNNIWSSGDIQKVFDASKQKEKFQELVSPCGDSSKCMPNPQMKHKHVGLRGPDAYSQKGGARYGFELRRGHGDERQLADLIRCVCRVISQIGSKNGEKPLKISSMCFGKERDEKEGYGWGDVIAFLRKTRCVDENAFGDEEGDFLERLHNITEEWEKQLIEWEYHLRRAKRAIWGNVSADVQRDLAFEQATALKLTRRMALILKSDWSKFPSPLALSLDQEREYLLQQIRESPKKGEKVRNTATLIELRFRISDFARRLSFLY